MKPNKSEKIRIICSECNKIVEVDKGSQPYIRCSDHKQTKSNKLTGHPPRLYTRSQVDEMINGIWENNKRVHLQQEVFYNKKIDELKAKLKEQAEEIFDDVGKISTASPKAVEKGYWKMRKKWVGKE